MKDIALYFEPEAYSTDTSLLMGRQAAGAAFFRAYAATRPRRAFCFSRERAASGLFGLMLARHGSAATRTEWVGVHDVARLGEAGVLYRPDPAIGADAWRRLRQAGPAAYSLCGITHTTATHAVMECVAKLLTDPVEEWDAVICTSQAVRDSLLTILEAQAEHLAERLGAQRLTLPQLPVIPLGVHTGDFDRPETARQAGRALVRDRTGRDGVPLRRAPLLREQGPSAADVPGPRSRLGGRQGHLDPGRVVRDTGRRGGLRGRRGRAVSLRSAQS